MKPSVRRAAGIAILGVAVACPAAAQIPATELPTLGGSIAYATAVSEGGHVVGFSRLADDREHAFLWTARDGTRDLTPLTSAGVARGVNDRGHVVGWLQSPNDMLRPFVWSEPAGLRELPLHGALSGAAWAINNSGQVLGRLDEDAVIWEPDGSLTRLPSIGGSPVVPIDMNEFGDVTGWSAAGLFRWTARDGFVLPGIVGTGLAINERGDVAGYGDIEGDGPHEPFVWSAAGIAHVLPPGPSEASATGVNNLQEVVGYAELPVGAPPEYWYDFVFLWSPAGGLSQVSPSDVEETGSIVINDAGLIAGSLAAWFLPDPGNEQRHIVPVVWRLRRTAADLGAAIQARIAALLERGLIRASAAHVLEVKLRKIEESPRGARRAAHARALMKSMDTLVRRTALPEPHALPIRLLAAQITQ